MNKLELWERYKKNLFHAPELGLTLDLSRMSYPEGFFSDFQPAITKALAEMKELEAGAIANPDENRMVGHYWLRNAALAPTKVIAAEIEFTIRGVMDFAAAIHDGSIRAACGRRFSRFLVIGIGGSALGPQFIADALGGVGDKMIPYFLDNTDPDGFDRTLAALGPNLEETLTIVISKSGGTKETRNGMLEAEAAYRSSGLDFPAHAVAVTGADSELDRTAAAQGWIARFPMWDWVGGRTSVTSAVGLLPAALQGLDILQLLDGAKACDEITRRNNITDNPAALLALMWYYGTGGTGGRDMVILPYKDRLLLFSRYLQQLIMESIGKEFDRDGNCVCQGISVYGNKGSTDQHAYVQQLREGIHNFFVTFIEVLNDRKGASLQVEQDVTSGDYLSGFFQGTRTALFEKGRESITITIDKIDTRSIGALIALYERTVGLYASLINVNAYHQPGVEAGKKAAGEILALQGRIISHLRSSGSALTVEETAAAIGAIEDVEAVFKILMHLAANEDRGIRMFREAKLTSSRFAAAN